MSIEIALPLSDNRTNKRAIEIPLPLGLDTVIDNKVITVSSSFYSSYKSSETVGTCLFEKLLGANVANMHFVSVSESRKVMKCTAVTMRALPLLRSCFFIALSNSVKIGRCSRVSNDALELLRLCSQSRFSEAFLIKTCAESIISKAIFYKVCSSEPITPAIRRRVCKSSRFSATQFLKHCRKSQYKKALRPDCIWVDVPIDENPDNPQLDFPCGKPPDSLKIPLSLRNTELFDSLMIQLPLACSYESTTPILSTYMIFNTITATIDGESVELFNVDISTSIDSFCWQISAQIVYNNFESLNLATRTDSPILSISINGYRWDVQLEAPDQHQEFINNTAKISGRSQSSQLLGESVMREPSILMSSLNARQIIDKQLEFLPFSLAQYNAGDWLIPGATYTQVGAPLDTILDLAKAGGNFVESHRYEKTISVKRRWIVPAWEIKNEAATFSLPANVAETIDSKRTDNIKYNSVYVIGNGANAVGGKVHRQLSNKSPEASSVTHISYTAQSVIREAGIAALSDSGVHTQHTVKTYLDDEHNIRLAEIGEIAEVTGKQTKGIVTGISISIGIENDAPVVNQILNIDSYDGD